MPAINQTIRKVNSFTDLPLGWHYGKGVPVVKEILDNAENFLLKAEGWDIVEANAFPGIDGQVELTFYNGNETISFMFELDETVSITEEKRGDLVSDIYDQSLDVAEEKLWDFSQKIQTIYDLSISDIGIHAIIGLEVPRFNDPTERKTHYEVFRSFPPDAYWNPGGRSATTSPTSTVLLQVTRSSFCV